MWGISFKFFINDEVKSNGYFDRITNQWLNIDGDFFDHFKSALLAPT